MGSNLVDILSYSTWCVDVPQLSYHYPPLTNRLQQLDYTAGVLPVTRVSADLDLISPEGAKKMKASNAVASSAFEMYDAQAMDGLPVGVQIVGQRFEEEKVLEGMKLVEGVLRRGGNKFIGLEI